ncbi:MAG: hypothetical protein U0L12_01645 [Ruminococcus sp.]|nr:hypothetical protein [Ruminococcus sp.]
MTGIRECILYRNFEEGELLENMSTLMEDISHPKVLYGKSGNFLSVFISWWRWLDIMDFQEICGIII